MRVKRYEGQYVHEVIEQIRAELGPDAVVLHTRWRNQAGLKRLLTKPQVEVWAGSKADVEALTDEDPAVFQQRAAAIREAIEAEGGLDVTDSDEVAAPVAALANGGAALPPAALDRLTATATVREARAAARAVRDGADEPPPPAPAPSPATAEDTTVALLAQFNETLARLEEQVARLQPPVAEPGPDSPRYRALVAGGVSPEVAAQIDAAAAGQTVTELLLDTFQTTGELTPEEGPKVIALIGPSGAGKTTTVAKLAGHYALERGYDVLLASTDVQRIGTFEQLKALGQLMQLATASLPDPEAARGRLQMARQAHDLILVDTAACSPADPDSWERLLDILIAVEPDEIHVVVPAGLKTREAIRLVEFFRQSLPVNGAVVTKLDECLEAGLLVDLAWRCLLPFSYLGVGQEIPGDLELATPRTLLERVWSARLEGEENPS